MLAALLRFSGLAQPENIIFDEAYYAKDACLYLGIGQDQCDTPGADEQSYVHPPLGKWIIASGIKIFGYNAFGWRVAAAFFGTLMVPLIYLFARKLFRDRWVAVMAGLLVATDLLLVVQSRVAMLDIFLAFFVMLGFFFLTFDFERVQAIRENSMLPFPARTPNRELEWRFAAGAAFGLALAVKWSAGFAIIGAAFLTLAWSLWLSRSHSRTQTNAERRPRILGRELVGWAMALLLVPLLVYLASYALWFKDNYRNVGPFNVAGYTCSDERPTTGDDFVDLQRNVFCYHFNLTDTHAYESSAWTWPLVTRPVAYYFTGPPETSQRHHIMAFANPAIWWAALAALVWLIVRSVKIRRAEQLITVGWLSQYVPWLLVARPLFFFYMTPIVPFMMLGLAGSLGALRRRGPLGRYAVTAYILIGILLLTVILLPVALGWGLSSEAWQNRMWFQQDCGETPVVWCWI